MLYNTTVVNPIDEMKTLRRWVFWELRTRGGNPVKVPINPLTGTEASTSDPATWAGYEAVSTVGGRGVGFVFTATDPFIFIDVDDCLLASLRADGTVQSVSDAAWKPHAYAIMAAVGGWWEVSQSGTGLHGIIRVPDKAAFADRAKKWVDEAGNKVECYRDGRYMAFGRNVWISQGPDNAQALLDMLPPASAAGTLIEVTWNDAPSLPGAFALSDDEVVARARRASGGARVQLGERPHFRDLYEGNAAALARFYTPAKPRADGLPYDGSSADLALASDLAFWTGGNPMQMMRLFNSSALGKRDKWLRKQKYRVTTIERAINTTTRIYQGMQFGLSLDEMRERYVFIRKRSMVLDTETGEVLSADEMKKANLPNVTTIEIPSSKPGEETTKKVARVFDLWMTDAQRKEVNSLMWNPQLEPGIVSGKRSLMHYNEWVPFPQVTAPPPGYEYYISQLKSYVAFIINQPYKQEAFLDYIAHAYQKPGELPHVHWYFVSETMRVGRGTLMKLIGCAFDECFAENLNLDDMLNGFNAETSRKVIATVDEIDDGVDHRESRGREHKLRSMTTTTKRKIKEKYGPETMEINVARWLICGNDNDGLSINARDGRWNVVITTRGRQDDAYYIAIRAMMERPEFTTSLQYFLANRDISNANVFKVIDDEDRQTLFDETSSPLVRVIRQFANDWPGNLATIEDVETHLGIKHPQLVLPRTSAQSKILLEAGIQKAKRIDWGHKYDKRQILIMKPGLSKFDVNNWSPAEIIKLIEAARCRR